MQSLNDVKVRIAAAAVRSGRRPEDIRLVAVTKTHGAALINEAASCGVTDIAENRVQELLSKYDEVVPGLSWHITGHLQTNKVKYIVDKVSMVQSVDSLRLAEEISKRCAAAGKSMELLLQVNIAGEEQKSGVSPAELPALYEAVALLPNIRLRGLMQIAPANAGEKELRKYFAEARRLYEQMPGADVLSMGMSGDFEIAIEEGANMVRIGSAIFGERKYDNGICG